MKNGSPTKAVKTSAGKRMGSLKKTGKSHTAQYTGSRIHKSAKNPSRSSPASAAEGTARMG